ncbi:hypothetical protein CCB80_04425 [Armatimonadetes bacterium Uphvl-Ar1]|nr:hypothetical protein CCB80_04425 [Armatimonadetes bacterium Uphvl-Ar1]
MLGGVSPYWTSVRAKNTDRLQFLKDDSRSNRFSKFTSIFNECAKSQKSDSIHFLSLILTSFRDDLRSHSKFGQSLALISDAEGSQDPEFWRAAYTALSINDAQHPSWGNIGSKVINIFPDDLLLIEGYVWDSVRGRGSLAQIKAATSLLTKRLAGVISVNRYSELHCWAMLAIFSRTRESEDYSRAKIAMRKYIDTIGDEVKAKAMMQRLDAYVRKWG